jgi:hypothetical protein
MPKPGERIEIVLLAWDMFGIMTHGHLENKNCKSKVWMESKANTI